jgi:hypothetical protein
VCRCSGTSNHLDVARVKSFGEEQARKRRTKVRQVNCEELNESEATDEVSKQYRRCQNRRR